MTDPCPSLETIEQFAFGHLSEADWSTIAEHAEGCEKCQSALATLDELDDAMVAQLRRHVLHRERQHAENACRVPLQDADRLQRLLHKLESGSTHGGSTSASMSSRDWMSWARDVFAPAAHPDSIQISEYQIEQVLGVGGMGVVFAARDKQLQRSVAIKVLRPERLTDEFARRRFVREARAIATIQHDHIVPVFQVGEDRGVPFFVMPVLQGCSLDKWLRTQPPPSLADVLRIGEQLADGVAAAHARGLVHRDIKPSNVWLEAMGEAVVVRDVIPITAEATTQPESTQSQLTGPQPKGTTEFQSVAAIDGLEVRRTKISDEDSGASSASAPRHRESVRPVSISSARVKLLDFGLARGAIHQGDEVSEFGLVLGTPAYMSPEQAAGREVNESSDLFSLGCVLYRLATGHLPFPGTTVTQQLTAFVTASIRPPRSLNPELPEPVAALIMHLLANDPQQRPDSASVVRDRLRELARVDWAQAARSARRASPVRRGVAALTAVMVLFVVAIAWQMRNQPSETDFTDASLNRLPMTAASTTDIQSIAEADGREVRLTEDEAMLSLDLAWVERVSMLPAEEQLVEVRRELDRRNPGLGAWTPVVIDGRVDELTIDSQALADIAPLAAFSGLSTLKVSLAKVSDLSPLGGLKLRHVTIESCPNVRDLSPLHGQPIEFLNLYGTPTDDLAWITTSRVQQLNLGGRSEPVDLSFLRGSPVTMLELNESAQRDISPLKGLPLTRLSIHRTLVTDLSPLAGMPLSYLDFQSTPVIDVTPLRGLVGLRQLHCDLKRPATLEAALALQSLELLNHKPVSEFLPMTVASSREPIATSLKPNPQPIPVEMSDDDAQALADRVHTELERLHPGVTIKRVVKIAEGRVVSYEINSTELRTIAPLADLPHLESVRLWSIANKKRELSDISPLKGKPLRTLELQLLPNLRDLSPLKGMPLELLNIYGTPLEDTDWLATLPLHSLSIGGRPQPVDLSKLPRLTLQNLNLNDAPYADLRPLTGINLMKLQCSATRIADLSPLKGMPLEELSLIACPINDYSPLLEMPKLRKLRLSNITLEKLELLRKLNLELINDRPAEQTLQMK